MKENEIKIYGCSDDLIEIEGRIREEFYYIGNEPTFIMFDNGFLVSVNFDNNGIWRFNVINKTTYNYIKHEATGLEDENGKDDYSDVIIIYDNNIKYAVYGELAK